jgi:hypothetical protein
VNAALVTPQIARAVLWFFRQTETPQPGHFTESLLETIAHADEENLEKLRLAFPGHVEALLAGRQETYGINRLKAIADGPGLHIVEGD